MNTKEMKKLFAEKLFGPTQEGCCILCKQEANDKNTRGRQAWQEFERSWVCGDCYESKMQTARAYAQSLPQRDLDALIMDALKEIFSSRVAIVEAEEIPARDIMDDKDAWQ